MDSPYVSRIRAATELLIGDVAPLGQAAMAGPTLLPGWDRAMLLTHLANNADGVRRALEAAGRGELGEMYPGGRPARDGAIEAGRGRSAAELKDRLAASAQELDVALVHAGEQVWHQRALGLTGEVEVGPGLVVGRLREVMVHHVDLQVGYGPRDWPTAWVMEEMDRAMFDLPGRLPPGVAVVLEATDVGQHWVAGSGDETDISGTIAELFVWLTGRAAAVGDQECPPLAPWR